MDSDETRVWNSFSCSIVIIHAWLQISAEKPPHPAGSPAQWRVLMQRCPGQGASEKEKNHLGHSQFHHSNLPCLHIGPQELSGWEGLFHRRNSGLRELEKPADKNSFWFCPNPAPSHLGLCPHFHCMGARTLGQFLCSWTYHILSLYHHTLIICTFHVKEPRWSGKCWGLQVKYIIFHTCMFYYF